MIDIPPAILAWHEARPSKHIFIQDRVEDLFQNWKNDAKILLERKNCVIGYFNFQNDLRNHTIRKRAIYLENLRSLQFFPQAF